MVRFKRIHLLGRSNVGKSTLIRALTGKKVVSGRRPGVTTEWREVESGVLTYYDMPGLGFISRIPEGEAESIRDGIVRSLEDGSQPDLALLVLDAKAFDEIGERWEKRGEIPIDVEMHDFLLELEIPFLVVANRMDKTTDPDTTLDSIGKRLGYLPPWRQWRDVIVPVSAKTGAGISDLRVAISKKLGLT